MIKLEGKNDNSLKKIEFKLLEQTKGHLRQTLVELKRSVSHCPLESFLNFLGKLSFYRCDEGKYLN